MAFGFGRRRQAAVRIASAVQIYIGEVALYESAVQNDNVQWPAFLHLLESRDTVAELSGKHSGNRAWKPIMQMLSETDAKFRALTALDNYEVAKRLKRQVGKKNDASDYNNWWWHRLPTDHELQTAWEREANFKILR